MQAPTREIETPIAKRKVVLKEWITGAQREYINAPLMNAVKTKPKFTPGSGQPDMEFGQLDIEAFLTESAHREISTFVVSVDEKTEDLLNEVLNMHEDDTEFIKEEINKVSKKKGTQST